MIDDDRLTAPDRRADDPDAALRPKSLGEFVGQEAARLELLTKEFIRTPWAR